MPTRTVKSRVYTPGVYELNRSTLPNGPASWDVTVDAPDWATPGRTLRVLVEQSFDGGATWQHWMDATFVSGPRRVGATSPALGLEDSVARAREVRVTATVGGAPVAAGFTIRTS